MQKKPSSTVYFSVQGHAYLGLPILVVAVCGRRSYLSMSNAESVYGMMVKWCTFYKNQPGISVENGVDDCVSRHR